MLTTIEGKSDWKAVLVKKTWEYYKTILLQS